MQAGDIAHMEEQMPRLLKTLARLYMTASKEMVSTFGAEGEKAVRSWLREIATWRGYELRKAHMALGLPVNMESIMRYWDNSSTYILKDEWDAHGFFSPYDVKVPVKKCPYADAWAEYDYWLWGHVYCDEMHQAVCEAYHPDSVVVIPRNLMKREGSCDFRWVMPPNASEVEEIPPYPNQDVLADWKSDTPEVAAKSSLRRTSRLLAIQIHLLYNILDEKFGDKGRKSFERFLEDFFVCRGEALAKEAKENNWDNLKTLLSNFDIPMVYAWDLEQVQKGDNKLDVTVNYCPLAETWQYMGGSKGGLQYCKKCYKKVFFTINPAAKVNISQCIAEGATQCNISIEYE